MTIPYGNALITRVEAALRKSFHQPQLRLNRRSDKRTGYFHVALLEDNVNVQRVGNERFALEILTPGVHADTFFFDFVALFEVTAGGRGTIDHELQHVSLSIFQKNPFGDLYPLCRAEWDGLVAYDNNSAHAQPHWHFAQNSAAVESAVLSFNSSIAEFSAERAFDRMIDTYGAHFAMSSLWDPRKPNSHKQQFTSVSEFASWFEKLIEYVAGQLAYVCSGSQAQPRPKEFDPDSLR